MGLSETLRFFVFPVFKCPLNAKQSMSTQDLVFHNEVEVLSYL